MTVKENFKKNAKDVVIMSDNGLMIPHDKKNEEAVLGALLIDSKAFDRVSDFLKEDMFFEKEHKLIFRAICELSMERSGIDIITVSARLKKIGGIENTEAAVVNLTTKVSSSANIVYHANILKDLYMYREIIGFCAETEGHAFERSVPVKDLLQRVEEGVYNLAVNEDRQTVSDMSSMLHEVTKEIEAAAARNGLSGLESGFNELDRKTSGWQKSDLIILAARPAMGKTALLLSMAKNMIEQQHPVLIFSLEMSKMQLMQRLIVNATELPATKIKSGKLNSADWMILNNQVTQLYKMPLLIDDAANQTIFELAAKARRYVREKGIECIFIDYLQLMHADGKNISNREQEVSSISRALKQLAKELNIPIIALSQLNRGVEARTGDNKRPMLSDLRESGAIEQDADLVLLLHRPEYYDIMMDDEGNSTVGMAELIIAKNRNGATGSVKLHFEAELIKFSDFSEYAIPALPFGNENAELPKKAPEVEYKTLTPKTSAEKKSKKSGKKKAEPKEKPENATTQKQDDDEGWDVIKDSEEED